ncbi:succinate dehydrogenase [Roseovarius aestuarii]|nr:succinate dehydrogenase [Roseovarius aestuarii]
MRAVLSLVAMTLTLTACSAANDAADTLARDRAKSVVNGVVTDRFPGVNAAPVTDCIIDAASAGEIISIAGASVTGVTPSVAEDVLTIAQRPEAVKCIAQNSISLLGV